MELTAGSTKIHITQTAREMGEKSARMAIGAMLEAKSDGRTPVLWLMAAPSGFEFYRAFIEQCSQDKDLARLCTETKYYQFDDYPVPRGDSRFPITFRHLLETRFFGPLSKVTGNLRDVHLLEVGSPDDESVAERYAAELLGLAADDRHFLIQLKGIGMDGHYGFHGAETPLDHPAGIIKVRMNPANVHQQMLDWPQYFPTEESVPKYAYTCDVALFLKAGLIIDNVPQAAKMYSVLAAYGTGEVIPEIPSSAVKRHANSHAFLTRDAGAALAAFRSARAIDPEAKLAPEWLARLDALWKADGTKPESKDAEARNVAEMRHVLAKLDII